MIAGFAKCISLSVLLAFPFFSYSQVVRKGTSKKGKILFENTTLSIVDLLAAASSTATHDSTVEVRSCKIEAMIAGEALNVNKLIIDEMGTANIRKDEEGRLIVNKKIFIVDSQVAWQKKQLGSMRLAFYKLNFEKEIAILNIGPENNLSVFFRSCQVRSLNFISPNTKLEYLVMSNCIVMDQLNFKVSSFGDLEIIQNHLYTISRSPKVDFKKDDEDSRNKYLDSLGYKIKSPFLDTVSYGRRNLLLPRLRVVAESGGNFSFCDNVVEYDSLHRISFYLGQVQYFNFARNIYNSDLLLNGTEVERLVDISDNKLGTKSSICFSDFTFPDSGAKLYWDEFGLKRMGYMENFGHDVDLFFAILYKGYTNEELSNVNSYHQLMKSYQHLLNVFKANGDIESANGCYSEMKDLEGRHLSYIYRTNGGFNNYFRWKLNRLMKYYTEHGTDPAKSIVISIWIIFWFGIFYFFFPSDWDVTSKSKLLKNYSDFIHKNEKGYIKPFISLVLGFILSLVNAVTLSLNAFTTLGFGNIPTHGLARYVCIIEGFIGWFLLSIFTVALINQVLD